MKRVGYALIVLSGFWILAGMGDMPKGPVIVPQTDVDYTARVIDVSGAVLDLKRFSCDGQTFLPGVVGKAHLTIDFRDIDTVSFQPEGATMLADVTLMNGENIRMTMVRKQSFFGQASFADVRIDLPDIRSISIARRHPVDP